MGCVKGVGFDEYPEQSQHVGQRVKVYFYYNLKQCLYGTIMRDDRTEPFRVIVRLDDGRVVLGTECQYSFRRSESGN